MAKRLLYIDDDATLFRLAQKALGRKGYDAVHALDPASGLERLSQGGIDAIVLDHYLQGSTGLDFLKTLNERGITTPVVYVTGSSEAVIAVEALKAGAADYVIKTVGEDFWPLMANAVEQAIENAELRAAREQAEQEIRAGKERAEILLAEVNHRVANSLALVAALIRLQTSAHESEEVKKALAETQARITAVAGMHRSLFTSDDVREVDMSRYLSSLINEVMGSVASDRGAIHLSLDLDPAIILPSDKAVSVGMIATELLTNAIKYAYAPGEPGPVRISLKWKDDRSALLVVEDDGKGFDSSLPPQGTGLGSRIVASMSKTVGSGISYRDKVPGTRAEIPISL